MNVRARIGGRTKVYVQVIILNIHTDIHTRKTYERTNKVICARRYRGMLGYWDVRDEFAPKICMM